jgi:hypothetical protein
MTATHVYLGDKLTRPALRDRSCTIVRRPDGKCARFRNGNMLVRWGNGRRDVVVGRRLRRLDKPADSGPGGD